MRVIATARSIRRLAAALAVAGLSLGCGSDESSSSAPGAAPAATTGAAASGAGAGTEVDHVITENVVPDTFPSDVPLYPGATPGSGLTIPGSGTFLTLETDDAIDTVIAHFRSELASSGWEVEDVTDGVDATKEGRSVVVRVRKSAESEKTHIAVSTEEG